MSTHTASHSITPKNYKACARCQCEIAVRSQRKYCYECGDIVREEQKQAKIERRKLERSNAKSKAKAKPRKAQTKKRLSVAVHG